MTDRQLTRRELRDLERAREIAAEGAAAVSASSLFSSESPISASLPIVPQASPTPVAGIPAVPPLAPPPVLTPPVVPPTVVTPTGATPAAVVQTPVAQTPISQSPITQTPVVQPPAAPAAPKTSGRRAAAAPAAPVALTADSVPPLLSGSITIPAAPVDTGSVPVGTANELFPRSGPIDVVQDTNSLVIEMPRDITNSTMVIADGGVTLTTGSITLPKLDTGEINLVVAAEAADAAVQEDKRDQIVTGIEPLPARRHQRSRKRQSVFPTKLRRGMGQVYIVLFSAILTAGVLGLVVIAYMLGYIKF